MTNDPYVLYVDFMYGQIISPDWWINFENAYFTAGVDRDDLLKSYNCKLRESENSTYLTFETEADKTLFLLKFA